MGRTKHIARDVKKYDAPQFIHNYDPETGRGPLHIADKYCTHDSLHKYITRCGRIMRPDHRGFRRDETLANFRLCKRCGTDDEFAQALVKSAEHNRQWAEKERQRSEQEAAARQQEQEEKDVRMNRVADAIEDGHIQDTVADGGLITFEYHDHRYEVKEVK